MHRRRQQSDVINQSAVYVQRVVEEGRQKRGKERLYRMRKVDFLFQGSFLYFFSLLDSLTRGLAAVMATDSVYIIHKKKKKIQ